MVTEFYDMIRITDNGSDNILIKNNSFEKISHNSPGSIIMATGITATENKNIVISDNTFRFYPWMPAIKIEGYNGITVSNNKAISIDDQGGDEIYIVSYRGNNSSFINNLPVDANRTYKIDVVGQNNTVQ